MNYNPIFSAADGSRQRARAVLRRGVGATDCPADFSVAPNSDPAVSHGAAFPAVQDKADEGAVRLWQNALP